MTLITSGVWALIWLIMVIARKDEMLAYDIDLQGNVWLIEGGVAG